MNFIKVEFIKSAASPKDFIYDGLPQAVFAGRSNVGKSSVINSLVKRKNFARVGSQPGKTSQINYFLIDSKAYLTDLPGYGYAKVSKAERDRWGKLMENYFSQSGLITLGVMIVDARHKPTNDDILMANWFKEADCRFIIVANKIDKVKKSAINENVAVIRETLALSDTTPLILYSAVTGTGRGELIAAIENALVI